MLKYINRLLTTGAFCLILLLPFLNSSSANPICDGLFVEKSSKETDTQIARVSVKPTGQTQEKIEAFAQMVMSDPVLQAKAMANPYWLAYVYYKHIHTQAPRAMLEMSARFFEEYSRIHQLELSLSEIDREVSKKLSDQQWREDVRKRSQELTKRDFEENQLVPLDFRRMPTWRSFLIQAAALPKTLEKIRRIVKREMSTAILDRNLFAFYGFHQLPGVREFEQRPWKKATVSHMTADQINGMSHENAVRIMRTAMEIEDPILGYSWESGKGFRFLLPLLGRFMGKNEEQVEYTKKTDKRKWCESAWCEEEKRHGNALARMIEAVSGEVPPRDNPNEFVEATNDVQGAIAHLISRETTEVGASSAYIVLAAHTTGELNRMATNLLRDELKHLTIASAAYIYLFGKNPWERSKQMLKQMKEFFDMHKAERTGGQQTFKDPITLTETVVTMLWIEYYTRKYLKELPYSTLRHIFEKESQLDALASVEVSAKRREEIERLERKGKELRDNRSLWNEKDRKVVVEQLAFEERNRDLIERITSGAELNGFKGAEIPGSQADREIRGTIVNMTIYGLVTDIILGRFTGPGKRTFSQNDLRLLRNVLLDRLRDYQIMSHESAQNPLVEVDALLDQEVTP